MIKIKCQNLHRWRNELPLRRVMKYGPLVDVEFVTEDWKAESGKAKVVSAHGMQAHRGVLASYTQREVEVSG